MENQRNQEKTKDCHVARGVRGLQCGALFECSVCTNPCKRSVCADPINVAFVQTPINVAFAHTPKNAAFAQTSINVASLLATLLATGLTDLCTNSYGLMTFLEPLCVETPLPRNLLPTYCSCFCSNEKIIKRKNYCGLLQDRKFPINSLMYTNEKYTYKHK